LFIPKAKLHITKDPTHTHIGTSDSPNQCSITLTSDSPNQCSITLASYYLLEVHSTQREPIVQPR